MSEEERINKRIKLLNDIINGSFEEISPKDAKILLDYITNLQEENEYSNHCNEELRKKITNLRYKIERLEEENKRLKQIIKTANMMEYFKGHDILQGSDNNE